MNIAAMILPRSLKLVPFLLISILSSTTGLNAIDEDYIIAGQNTARKVIIRSSSALSASYRAAKAFDDGAGTCWISAQGPGPHWISVDFGAKRLMTSIIVRPGRKDGYHTLRHFKLQFLDGDWFDFAAVDTASRRGGAWSYKDAVEINLGGVDASTFRIFIPPEALAGNFASIAEIEIYLGSARVRCYDERLRGLSLPVKNAFLPAEDYCYPNAPRAYRGGRHAGIDIYRHHGENSYTPLPVTKDTPVYAADAGTVIKADRDYRAPDMSDWNRRSAHQMSHPTTFVKRSFGGRGVWIDHRNGIVTVYEHLSKIDRSIRVGGRVSQGDRIGWAGNSGLAGEAEGKDYGIHLHFEIWIDGSYLGTGLGPAEIRKYLNWIFFPEQ
ncbi:MAG: M23 family metallopeptidase [Spirochaetes bacterium]|nr:M23 family metallopeptidase [Spirochaetota bacterium]